MKKNILVFTFILVTLIGASAQKKFTYSYAYTGTYGEYGSSYGSGHAMWIDFYDGYIMYVGAVRFNYSHKKTDGSLVYSNSKGNIIVSSDYSNVTKAQQTSFMYQTSWIYNNYKYLGKGSQPAIDFNNENR